MMLPPPSLTVLFSQAPMVLEDGMLQYSDLELAINTMVTEFHRAADDAPTMNATQFQSFVAKEMLPVATTVESEGGLGRVLEQMGVGSDQDISFDKFWTLINSQAVQMFNSTSKEKDVKCNCLLQ